MVNVFMGVSVVMLDEVVIKIIIKRESEVVFFLE